MARPQVVLLLGADGMPAPLAVLRVLVLDDGGAEVLAQHRRRRVGGVADVVVGAGLGAGAAGSGVSLLSFFSSHFHVACC